MTDKKMTDRSIPSTSFRAGRGCLLAAVLSAALWALLIVSALAALGGCASAPVDRWEALSVAGTPYTTVYLNGLPRAGPYVAVADGTGQARIYRAGRYMGTGRHALIEPSNGYVRIDVSPNARIQITGQ